MRTRRGSLAPHGYGTKSGDGPGKGRPQLLLRANKWRSLWRTYSFLKLLINSIRKSIPVCIWNLFVFEFMSMWGNITWERWHAKQSCVKWPKCVPYMWYAWLWLNKMFTGAVLSPVHGWHSINQPLSETIHVCTRKAKGKIIVIVGSLRKSEYSTCRAIRDRPCC